MKKDNFISVGIILNSDNNTSDIEKLHKILSKKYNYFEVLLLDNNINCDFSCKDLLVQLNNIRVIKLAFNVDIEVANTSLIENCIGDYCVIVDLAHDDLGDLENMLEKAEQYDVIIGKQIKKVQSFFESITSKIFYKAISLFAGITIDSMYSDFFIINRKVINFITKNEDKVKFLKLLKFNNGFSRYEHSYMPIGKKSNKRTFFENINFAIDILVNYSHRIIRMATILSLFTSVINLLYIVFVLGSYLLKDDIAQGWTSLNLYNSSIYFILFLVLAVLGEYIRIIVKNQKNIPSYEIIDEKSSLSLLSSKKNVDNE